MNHLKPDVARPSSLKPVGPKSLTDSDPIEIDKSVTFESVGGLDQHVKSLKEMVLLPLLYPEVFTKFGVVPPRGVIFHGPPGTGKTLLARALANACSNETQKVAFFMRKGADVLSKWVGESERQLKLLFEQARNMQPSIIFFDELDGLAPVRSSKQDQIHASIVTTLLALLDGLDSRGQVIVIGATNRIDAIDPALRRPGRFDREFLFQLPDKKSRENIIKIHTKAWDPKPELEIVSGIAEVTNGFSGSDLKSLCSEAMLRALERSYPHVYKNEKKYVLDLTKISITAQDFAVSLSKITSTSRKTSNLEIKGLKGPTKHLLDIQLAELASASELNLPFTNYSSLVQSIVFPSLNQAVESKTDFVYHPRLCICSDDNSAIEHAV
jgi:SpoVK/Ycf46/Vps4 family AAA+-type ATPase